MRFPVPSRVRRPSFTRSTRRSRPSTTRDRVGRTYSGRQPARFGGSGVSKSTIRKSLGDPRQGEHHSAGPEKPADGMAGQARNQDRADQQARDSRHRRDRAGDADVARGRDRDRADDRHQGEGNPPPTTQGPLLREVRLPALRSGQVRPGVWVLPSIAQPVWGEVRRAVPPTEDETSWQRCSTLEQPHPAALTSSAIATSMQPTSPRRRPSSGRARAERRRREDWCGEVPSGTGYP